MSEPWRVDRFTSYLIGETLRGVTVEPARHPLQIDRRHQIWTEIVFVSICHQANWDLFHDRVMSVAGECLESLHPSRLAAQSSSEFRSLFGDAFSPDRLRLSERVRLLQNLGLKAGDWPSCARLLNDCDATLAGPDGIYSWLSTFEAFAQDPLQKKSRVLVHQLLRYGLVSVVDAESIAPAIDYHLIRLYVRTGRVLPAKSELAEKLVDGRTARVEFLTALRRAVQEAMHYTAASSGLRLDQLNHIEWQIARSFCTRLEARCHKGPTPEKRLDEGIVMASERCGGHCPLVGECLGVLNEELRNIQDPRSVRAYY